MRFMMMVKGAENQGPAPQAMIDAVDKLTEELVKAGTVVILGGLAPSAMSARVRVVGGKVTAIDGPFTEAKEVIGGFAICEYKSKEEALESAKRMVELHRQHWPEWEGESEIRQVFGSEDFVPPK